MGGVELKGGKTAGFSQVGLLDAMRDVQNAGEIKQQKNFLSGVNLSIGRVNVAANSLSPAALINLIDQYFEGLKKTAENMGVSEEEMERKQEQLEEERAKELRRIQDALREGKIEVEDALVQIANATADSKNMKIFEQNKAAADGGAAGYV